MNMTYHSYIDGQWHQGDNSYAVFDPGTGQECARCSAIGYAEAVRAIEGAAAAFTDWGRMPAMKRADYLLQVAANMRARRDEIAQTLTRENGKPLFESYAEFDMAVDHFRWFAEEARRAYGRVVPNQAAGKRHLVLKRPFGVVAAISPWNFPLALSARKIAPALAAGCTVVLRPARQTPLSCVLMTECIVQAAVPKGVFNLLLGAPDAISKAFMEHPACRKVSFTGSTAVGKMLVAQSAPSITKLALELGGQAPVLIFNDCNFDAALDGAVRGKVRNVGQSCVAANRFYVQRGIYDRFVEQFSRAIGALKVGYGLQEGSEVGALQSQKGVDTVVAHVQDAVQHGGELMTGGSQIYLDGAYKNGTYFAPAVIAGVPQSARCMREETFGPVAPVHVFDEEEEAIDKANAVEFGLAAYAYTNDLNRVLRISEQLEAGSIGINDPVPAASPCPFGGFKQSGSGRELGIEGMDEFLEPVHVSIGGQSY